MLVYADETGFDKFFKREFARALRGQKIFEKSPGRKFERYSVVAGWCNGKVIAPFGYQGTCCSQLFNLWIEKVLVPELKPGQIVIMDNASIHKSAETKRLIEEAGCTLLYLPPYSPDLNPIEHCWANLKHKPTSVLSNCKINN